MIQGQVTVDLVPGEYLQKIIQYFPALADTIFEKDPYLLYGASHSKLHKVTSNPIMIEGIIAIPRIFLTPFGHKYITKSCPWEQGGRWYQLRSDHAVIIPTDRKHTYTTNGCKEQENVVVCEKSKMSSTSEKCSPSSQEWDLTGCRVLDVTNSEKEDVLIMPEGIVICTPSNLTLLKADMMGFMHTKTVTTSGPTFITINDADTLITGHRHYFLNNNGYSIKVTKAQR